jgi:hypothetical protein
MQCDVVVLSSESLRRMSWKIAQEYMSYMQVSLYESHKVVCFMNYLFSTANLIIENRSVQPSSWHRILLHYHMFNRCRLVTLKISFAICFCCMIFSYSWPTHLSDSALILFDSRVWNILCSGLISRIKCLSNFSIITK